MPNKFLLERTGRLLESKATTSIIQQAMAFPIFVSEEGLGSGVVVSILAFYSDDPSSNPAGN